VPAPDASRPSRRRPCCLEFKTRHYEGGFCKGNFVLHAVAGDCVDAPSFARNSPVHQLSLRFDGALRVLRQDPPWKVIRAFGPLVHLHNVSGGILAGDRLSLDVAADAPMLITTTGATRLYRHRAGAEDSEQHLNFSIGEGAMLEYLPDLLIPYAGSRHRQYTRFSLARNATLVWWEVLANTFAFERLQISNAVDVCGKPALREDFLLEPAKRAVTSPSRMGTATHLTSFNVFSEGKTSTFWSILAGELRKIAPETWGVSTVASGVVVRALSSRHHPRVLDALRNRASLFLTGEPALPPRKVY
jgi:urease accessory protein